MEALINKLKDYRDTLSEPYLEYDTLYHKNMQHGICLWYWITLSEKEANIIRTLLKRIKYDGGYICDTVSKLQSKIGHPKEHYKHSSASQHKRILALGYMIEVLEYRLKPWYKRNPFLFKRGLNLN